MFFKVDTNWLDVCPNNGNLLAAAGYDKNIKIYDHREAKIVKVFEMMHTGRKDKHDSFRLSNESDSVTLCFVFSLLSLYQKDL